jgi:hypothetical protein
VPSRVGIAIGIDLGATALALSRFGAHGFMRDRNEDDDEDGNEYARHGAASGKSRAFGNIVPDMQSEA